MGEVADTEAIALNASAPRDKNERTMIIVTAILEDSEICFEELTGVYLYLYSWSTIDFIHSGSLISRRPRLTNNIFPFLGHMANSIRCQRHDQRSAISTCDLVPAWDNGVGRGLLGFDQ